MSAGDYIPHRRLINKSLRKAADELRVKIDAYQIEYDRRVEECKSELEREEEKRNSRLEEFRSSLNQELQNDQDLLNTISEDVTRYVDKYLYGQYIDTFLDVKNSLYRVLQENESYLSAEMNNIGSEIDILEQRKQVMVSFTDVHGIVELMQLSGYEMPSESLTDASLLLKKINVALSTLEKEKEIEIFSLRRLKNIVQQRADYLAIIQYIDWVIQQKKQFSKQLSSKRDGIRSAMAQLRNEIAKLVDEKRTLKQDLSVLAERVRMHWARPITYLSADIDYSSKKRTESVQDKNEKIQIIKDKKRERRDIGAELHAMAESHVNDQFRWGRLKQEGEDLTSEINALSSEIDGLKSDIEYSSRTIDNAKQKRKEWFTRKKSICDLIRNHTGFFDYGKKISVRDEHTIIESRLTEIAEIRAEGIRSAEQKCNEERWRIDANYQRARANLAADENKASKQLSQAKKELLKAETLVRNATIELKKSQQNDNRFFLVKLFGGETDEVISARNQLKMTEQSLAKAKAIVAEYENEIEHIHSKLETEAHDYELKVRICIPHYLRPTAAENLEEKKLMFRKQKLDELENQEARL